MAAPELCGEDRSTAAHAEQEEVHEERPLAGQGHGRDGSLAKLSDQQDVHRIEQVKDERLGSNGQRDLEHDRVEFSVAEELTEHKKSVYHRLPSRWKPGLCCLR